MAAMLLTSGIGANENNVVKAAGKYDVSSPSKSPLRYDYVYFGNYWQADTNGDGVTDKNDAKLPIKWRVLNVDGDDAYLVSDKSLFGAEFKDKDWKNSELRKNLNQTFFKDAFSANEQKSIYKSPINNPGGIITEDHVFMLSRSDLNDYLWGTYVAGCTDYAKSIIGNTIRDYDSGMEVAEWWIRKSPVDDSGNNSYVDIRGNIDIVSTLLYPTSKRIYGIRPAIHINLSNKTWVKAGYYEADYFPEKHNHSWIIKEKGNIAYAYCNQEKNSCDFYGTDSFMGSAGTLSIDAKDMVYTGKAYNSDNKYVTVKSVRMPYTVSSMKYYLSDGKTLTNSTNSGARVEGEAPVLPGKYVVKYMLINNEIRRSGGIEVTVSDAFAVKGLPITGISAKNVSVIYDGKEHGITVTGADAADKVTFGTSANAINLSSLTYKKASDKPYEIWYKVERSKYYEPYIGKAILKISPVVKKEEVEINTVNLSIKSKLSWINKKCAKVTWTKVSKADGYDLYFRDCDGKNVYDKVDVTINDPNTTSFTFDKIDGKKIKKTNNYKYSIKAFMINGNKKVYIGESLTCHYTGNKHFTEPKKIKVNKTKVTLKAGKKIKLKFTVVKKNAKKKLLLHHTAKLRYLSSNSKIASVDKKGNIKAVSKGTCKVYAFGTNGKYKAVTIKVK